MSRKPTRRLVTDHYYNGLEALAAGHQWGPDIAEASGRGIRSSANMAGLIGHGWAKREDSGGASIGRYSITELGVHALVFARFERELNPLV